MTPTSKRQRLSLDFDWRFHLGSAADAFADFNLGVTATFGKAGEGPMVTSAAFDDSSWRLLDVPHDWAVELPFDGEMPKCFVEHGSKPIGRTRPATAVGWYRRSLDISKEDLGQRISVEFDGVFRDCMVWVNSHFVGRHLSGYGSFRFDLTDILDYGGKNTLVVRVDASDTEGWFYEGAGIYRHVWLSKTSPLHVLPSGTFVTSEVHKDSAAVTVQTKIINESDEPATFQLNSIILNPAGKNIAHDRTKDVSLAPWTQIELSQQMKVARPLLWSIESPNLYQLQTTVTRGRETVDATQTTFGIRTLRWDANEGFFLNDKPVKIKGVCCHQDHAGVGSAVPDRLQTWRIERLKEMGCNAYRTSHNPPASELLDACDRLGMLVMDETRLSGSSPETLGELESLILRDRNHPCIFIWSIANEEHAVQGTAIGRRIATTMKRLVKRLDPTRAVTAAMNNGGQGDGFVSVLDVHGWNYLKNGDMDAFHKAHPTQPIIGSEEASTLTTRGIYQRDPVKCHTSAYAQEVPSWGTTAEQWWTFYDARPYVAGGFIWTGFDYRGEPNPYRWPCISSHFGVLDVCGFPKDHYYYYQAWWTDQTILHILPHWNWANKQNEIIDVWCYSNCHEVELLLNGTSQGRQPMPRNSHLEWKVPYAPGTLQARGYRDGKLIATQQVSTTGQPAAIRLSPDRTKLNADGQDVAVFTVQIVDAHGHIVPNAENEVTFEIKGGTIIGVGNGNPSSHESDKAPRRRAFAGLCQVIVQAPRHPGRITLSAQSEKLKKATALLTAGQ